MGPHHEHQRQGRVVRLPTRHPRDSPFWRRLRHQHRVVCGAAGCRDAAGVCLCVCVCGFVCEGACFLLFLCCDCARFVCLDVYARVRLAPLLSRRILSVTAATFGRVDSSHVTSALCAVQLAYTSSKGAVLAMTRELSVIHAR